ncbi:hypothetical protein M427DRAFT_139191 [Gonapodya prolifera JEL478]|uniref:Uncharacterized protein n=1 Tax=Gonapodya prolifera (strain JEL478) TaxID=1344416 RepID=A0A139A206_GONPJ|nr:hypothetical protein M427DRAFT_139191 [Gonapodya prolifera JEL478]|eukprot:KXS10575.1 hypothetical protein M427DRAFT_139191 [Gonapodya prolifera JEL478]
MVYPQYLKSEPPRTSANEECWRSYTLSKNVQIVTVDLFDKSAPELLSGDGYFSTQVAVPLSLAAPATGSAVRRRGPLEGVTRLDLQKNYQLWVCALPRREMPPLKEPAITPVSRPGSIARDDLSDVTQYDELDKACAGSCGARSSSSSSTSTVPSSSTRSPSAPASPETTSTLLSDSSPTPTRVTTPTSSSSRLAVRLVRLSLYEHFPPLEVCACTPWQDVGRETFYTFELNFGPTRIGQRAASAGLLASTSASGLVRSDPGSIKRSYSFGGGLDVLSRRKRPRRTYSESSPPFPFPSLPAFHVLPTALSHTSHTNSYSSGLELPLPSFHDFKPTLGAQYALQLVHEDDDGVGVGRGRGRVTSLLDIRVGEFANAVWTTNPYDVFLTTAMLSPVNVTAEHLGDTHVLEDPAGLAIDSPGMSQYLVMD